MSEVLSRHACSACGTPRRPNNLKYDPNTFLPYCKHAEICNPDHPNSPANIIVRGEAVVLVNLTEAEKMYKEKLLLEHPDPDAVVLIRKLLEHPMSLRLNNPDLAKYIVNVKSRYNFDSMADTVRYLLTSAMEGGNTFYKELSEAHAVVEEKKEVEKAIQEVEKPVVVEKPVEVVVPETKEEEEEDWVV